MLAKETERATRETGGELEEGGGDPGAEDEEMNSYMLWRGKGGEACD